jgi:signal transduction histidine kinase
MSLGLIGIRERALVWGGQTQIQTSPGKGTEIIVSIPLNE